MVGEQTIARRNSNGSRVGLEVPGREDRSRSLAGDGRCANRAPDCVGACLGIEIGGVLHERINVASSSTLVDEDARRLPNVTVTVTEVLSELPDVVMLPSAKRVFPLLSL